MAGYIYAGQFGPEAIQDAAGNALSEASVQVNTTVGTLATIYTSRTKAVAAVNPVVPVDGNITFYADPGQYDLYINVRGSISAKRVMVPPDPGEVPSVFNVISYGAKGDGTTDDTGAVQAALDVADQRGTVYFPPGTFKVGTLTYRNQSLAGAGREMSVIKGKPGEDILRSDATVPEYGRGRFVIHDLTFTVDDSVDASGSFSRGGVGNAAIAFPNPTATGISLDRMRLNHPWLHNVYIHSISDTVRGLNKSCGIYDQGGMIIGRVGPAFELGRLVYGWWTDAPTSGLDGYDYFSDHNWWNGVHVQGCGTGLRLCNMSYSDFSNLSFHECGSAFIGVVVNSGIGPNGWQNNNFDALFIEGTITTPITIPGVGHTVGNLRIQGPHGTVVFHCNSSVFNEVFISTLSGTETPPVLELQGSRNDISLHAYGESSATYLRDLVYDNGRGNRVTVSNIWGSSHHNTRLQVSRDGRTRHERDADSVLLGHTSSLFASGKDLLVNPFDIVPTAGTLGVNWTWALDTNSEVGSRFEAITGSGAFASQVLGGKNSFRVGEFLPAAKVRVYVKALAATGGTQDWYIHRVSDTANLGSKTLTWTTSYTVQSWDIDLTGQSAGTALQLTADVMGGGGAAPVHIAWVAFRPYEHDALLGTYAELPEQGSDAAAPNANRVRVYARDNGSGKTQLVARFNSGAVQVLATEP